MVVGTILPITIAGSGCYMADIDVDVDLPNKATYFEAYTLGGTYPYYNTEESTLPPR